MQHPVAWQKITAVFADRQELASDRIADKAVVIVVTFQNRKKDI
jgi:hypothetical protein